MLKIAKNYKVTIVAEQKIFVFRTTSKGAIKYLKDCEDVSIDYANYRSKHSPWYVDHSGVNPKMKTITYLEVEQIPTRRRKAPSLTKLCRESGVPSIIRNALSSGRYNYLPFEFDPISYSPSPRVRRN